MHGNCSACVCVEPDERNDVLGSENADSVHRISEIEHVFLQIYRIDDAEQDPEAKTEPVGEL